MLQIVTTITAPAGNPPAPPAENPSVADAAKDTVEAIAKPDSEDDSIWTVPPEEFDFSVAAVKVSLKSVAINLNKESECGVDRG
jgi:hypothetical protein